MFVLSHNVIGAFHHGNMVRGKPGWARDVAPLMKNLPSMHKALSSVLRTTETERGGAHLLILGGDIRIGSSRSTSAIYEFEV